MQEKNSISQGLASESGVFPCLWQAGEACISHTFGRAFRSGMDGAISDHIKRFFRIEYEKLSVFAQLVCVAPRVGSCITQ